MLNHSKDIKRSSKLKWIDREYHAQGKKNWPKISFKMSYATTHFPELLFCGPHTKTHGVRGLTKYDHLL